MSDPNFPPLDFGRGVGFISDMQCEQTREIVLLNMYLAIIDFELKFPDPVTPKEEEEAKTIFKQKDLFRREIQKALSRCND